MCAEVIFCSQGEGEDPPQQPLRKNVSNQHVAGFASYGGSEFLTTAYLKPPGKEEKQQSFSSQIFRLQKEAQAGLWAGCQGIPMKKQT